MSTQSLKIAGFEFNVPAPYAEGAVTLTTAEASTLNQTLAENIRNNIAARIKAAKEVAEKAGRTFSLDTEQTADPREGAAEGSTVTLREAYQHYADTYEFGVRRTSTKEPVDPVEREAHRIAKDVVSKALADKGMKAKDLPEGKFDEAVKAYAATDDVQKEARRRVKAKEGIGGDLLADLGIAPAQAAG